MNEIENEPYHKNRNPSKNFLIPVKYQFSNNSACNFNSSPSIVISPEPCNNRSILQSTLNPYELISTTLHNNEFSPTVHLYNLRRKNEFLDNSTDKDGANICCNQRLYVKSTKFNSTQHPPPPPPAVESLPLSVKLASNISSKDKCMYLNLI